jgi:hypothetical protein
MNKCLEKHKHLIFLKQEQWLLSKFLFKLKSENYSVTLQEITSAFQSVLQTTMI